MADRSGRSIAEFLQDRQQRTRRVKYDTPIAAPAHGTECSGSGTRTSTCTLHCGRQWWRHSTAISSSELSTAHSPVFLPARIRGLSGRDISAPRSRSDSSLRVFNTFSRQDEAAELCDDLLLLEAHGSVADRLRSCPCSYACRRLPPLKLFSVETRAWSGQPRGDALVGVATAAAGVAAASAPEAAASSTPVADLLFDVFGDEVEVDAGELAVTTAGCELSEGAAAGSAEKGLPSAAPAPLESILLAASALPRCPDAAPHPSGLSVALPKTSTSGAGVNSRRFLVADIESFYRSYVAAAPQNRHCYEIVREDTPCRLFFDLEYRRGRCQVKPSTRGRQPVAGTAIAATGDYVPSVPAAPAAASPASAADTAWVELNRGVNGDVLVAYLLFRVAGALRRDFGASLTACDVVHLESSTAGKFSRHLTLHCWRPSGSAEMPGSGEQTRSEELSCSAGGDASTAGTGRAAGAGGDATSPPRRVPCLFRSVEHAGRWVKRLMAELQAEREAEAGARAAGDGDGVEGQDEGGACEPLVEALWVQTADECHETAASASSASAGGASPGGLQLQRSPFVDMGVYTRNRAMRMMLSSKRGKTAPLMPAHCNRFGIRDDIVAVTEGSGSHNSCDAGAALATSVGEGSSCRVQLSHGAAPGPDDFRHWLRAVQPVGRGGAAGVAAAASPHDPLVQIGPAAWERGLWEASLITGTIPPLPVLTAIANFPDAVVSSSTGAAAVSVRSYTAGSAAVAPHVGAKRPRPADDSHLSAIEQRGQLAPCAEAAVVATMGAQGSRSAAACVAPTRSEYCAALGSELLHCSGQPAVSVAARPGHILPSAETKSTSADTVSTVSQWRRPAHLGSSRLVTSAETRGTPVPFAPLLDFIRCCAAGPAELALVRWAEALRASGAASTAALDAVSAGIGVRSWSAIVLDVPPPAAPTSSGGGRTDAGAATTVPAPAQVIQRVYLELTGSRWCNNVGRQHASNGIKWTVELASGVAWQSCWDQGSCAGYRSPHVRIPLELLPDQLPATSPANGSLAAGAR